MPARSGEHLLDLREEALDAIAKSLDFFASNVARHNADEEASFFPRLREQLPATDLTLLGRLEGDHVIAEGLLSQIRSIYDQLTDPAAPGDCEVLKRKFLESVSALTTLFRDHIAAEDEQLIPLACSTLSEPTLRQISVEMKARRGQ